MKPPSRLPNGKVNPQYTKWWRSTSKGKASVKKWNQSGTAKAIAAKYRNSPKGRAQKAIHEPTVTCKDCGVSYLKSDVLSRGYRMVGNYGCICDLCEV